ncbi:hypothetical+protein [Methylocapsa aurea]|uniref:hypothetical protein n=1 Tax=Methylocapsa aurea TaxID=663610 RepID=UPI003D18F8D5
MIDGFTYSDSREISSRVLAILHMLKPYSVKGYTKVRVGGENDGGYVMLDDFANISAAYSLGINNDVEWDMSIAERGINIYQYDHTINGLPKDHPLFHWRKVGIGEGENLSHLDKIIDDDGFSGHNNLILKCDIEGCEWLMLAQLPAKTLEQFRQITMEMHGFGHIDQADYANLILDAVTAITKLHRVVHVHANNNSAYCIVGGVPIPATLEITFARIDSYDLEPSQETFPTDLDSPCFPGRADYSLGKFVF